MMYIRSPEYADDHPPDGGDETFPREWGRPPASVSERAQWIREHLRAAGGSVRTEVQGEERRVVGGPTEQRADPRLPPDPLNPPARRDPLGPTLTPHQAIAYLRGRELEEPAGQLDQLADDVRANAVRHRLATEASREDDELRESKFRL